MKNFSILLILLVSISLMSFAEKDINAWKGEKNLDQQYAVFKKNLNYWSGSYFLTELQLNQFYNAVSDSIAVLGKEVVESKNQVQALQNELNSKFKQIEDIQIELNASTKRENSINVLGMYVNKIAYTLFMYLFILGVLSLSGVVYLLFKRSNIITRRTKKDYNELKEEFELQKKSSLERYTKINMELHQTRLQLNKK